MDSDVESTVDSNLDATLPYAFESQGQDDDNNDVYRVGWSHDAAPEYVILSDSEEVNDDESNTELWTHHHHPDHEPAPFTGNQTERSIEEITIDSESEETQSSVGACILFETLI